MQLLIIILKKLKQISKSKYFVNNYKLKVLKILNLWTTIKNLQNIFFFSFFGKTERQIDYSLILHKIK